MSTNAWMFIIIGPIWATLYYGLFRFLIVKLDLKTPVFLFAEVKRTCIWAAQVATYATCHRHFG